jgi:hypothetical protein
MADSEQTVEMPEVEHDVEEDMPEVEEHEGGEMGDEEEAPASTACDNLPGVAADTPSGGQPVIAKLLISNAAAGSVIGKVGHSATNMPVTAVAGSCLLIVLAICIHIQGGQTIEQIQKNSGARVQLSRAGEFYPGKCACLSGFRLADARPQRTACWYHCIFPQPLPRFMCAHWLMRTWAVHVAAPAAGTSERVLLLSGTLHSVLTSVFLMLEKLPKEPVMAMGRAAGKPREDAVSS